MTVSPGNNALVQFSQCDPSFSPICPRRRSDDSAGFRKQDTAPRVDSGAFDVCTSSANLPTPMPKYTDLHKILLVGSGPIVIGQGCEFDYSGVQACKALKEEGYEVVLVNSNPATIMTDPEFASQDLHRTDYR